MFKAGAKFFTNTLFVFSLILFSSICLKAQNNNQEQMHKQDDPHAQIASEVSEDLAGKLSLNDAQTTQLKQIIVSYQDDVQGAVQAGKSDFSTEKATANAAIEDLLTDTQKSNWENAKADFWTTVDSKVSSTPMQQKSQGIN